MKRVMPFLCLFVMLILAGCNSISPILPGEGGNGDINTTPTLSDEQMQTQIALLITAMPTATEQPQEQTPTEPLPTLPVETVAPTNTEAPEPTQAPPTETAAPTETTAPTEALTATQEATEAVTQAVTPTNTQPPAPAFTPPPGDPRSRLGAPTSTDPMDNAQNWVWPTGSDQFTRGGFSNGAMVVTALADEDGWRMANPTGRPFSNIYLEGTFRTGTCSGSDHYGLIVRVPNIHEPDQGYLFGATCDGRYSLRRWDGKVGNNGEMRWLVNWTTTSAISTGSNQTNRLGIFTVGNRLILYANGTLLTEVSDSSFANGNFGVFVGRDVTNDLTIHVDEMSYWDNPQP